MDRASRVLRRSGVKLLSLGSHADLNVLISQIKDMRNTAKTFSNAQNAASQDFLKWAANEENRAIQDVANQLAELNLLWAEVEREFTEKLKQYRHMFEMILEGEKHVSQTKTNLLACEQKEHKIKKELKKAAKRAPRDEIRGLESKLSQAERAKDLAQIEVGDVSRENEAVKMIRLKEGLLAVSEAYIDFGRKCSTVFEAQRDIILQLPDVHGRDLEDIKYTGSGTTKYFVQNAKEKLRNYRRQSDFSYSNEPPPPYSPEDNLDSSLNSPHTLPTTQDTSPRRQTQPSSQTPYNIEDYRSDSDYEDDLTGAMAKI